MLYLVYDNLPKNYDDNQMFCGGASTQWEKNGGKCGICGEAYDAVKKYEKGGIYYTGIIAGQYTEGGILETTIQV